MLSFLRNKANSRRRRVGRGPGDEGRGSCTNKANSPTWPRRDAGRRTISWAHCAKQSQFAVDGQARPSPRPEALTLPPPKGDKRVKQSQFGPETGPDKRRQDGQPGARRDKSCDTRRTRQKSGSTDPTCDIGPETRVETQLGDFCRGRQTKPIRPEVSDRASPVGKRSYGYLYIHRPTAKQSQFPAVPGGMGPGGRTPCGVVQTKPIRSGASSWRLDNQEHVCETKPIPADARWDEVTGTSVAGQLCKTNPICPAGPGGTESRGVGREELCETKPIWPGCSRRRSPLQCWRPRYCEIQDLIAVGFRHPC
jgi:hypothetical protein